MGILMAMAYQPLHGLHPIKTVPGLKSAPILRSPSLLIWKDVNSLPTFPTSMVTASARTSQPNRSLFPSQTLTITEKHRIAVDLFQLEVILKVTSKPQEILIGLKLNL